MTPVENRRETKTLYPNTPVGGWDKDNEPPINSHLRLGVNRRIVQVAIGAFLPVAFLLTTSSVAKGLDVGTAASKVDFGAPETVVTRQIDNGFVGFSGTLSGGGIAPVNCPLIGEDDSPVGDLSGGPIRKFSFLQDWEAELIAKALHEMENTNNRIGDGK